MQKSFSKNHTLGKEKEKEMLFSVKQIIRKQVQKRKVCLFFSLNIYSRLINTALTLRILVVFFITLLCCTVNAYWRIFCAIVKYLNWIITFMIPYFYLYNLQVTLVQLMKHHNCIRSCPKYFAGFDAAQHLVYTLKISTSTYYILRTVP